VIEAASVATSCIAGAVTDDQVTGIEAYLKARYKLTF
jgi:hypothetical protein